MIEQADAAARHLGADRLRFDGSVQAEIGVLIAAVKIERPRAQRIVDAARQPGRVMRIDRHAANHVCGRRPVRPFGLAADDRRAAKIERFLAADADGVAHCGAARLNEIEPPFADVDDDRPRSVGAGEGDLLAKQAGIDPGEVERRDLMPMVVDRAIGDGVPERIVARPERNPALRCATPEQERDPRKNAAPVDNPVHCSQPSERSIQAPESLVRPASHDGIACGRPPHNCSPQRKFEAKPCAEAEMNLPKASTEATLLCS